METVYAPNTDAQMEIGHDYARALRAHILSTATVTKHLIDASPETKEINHEVIVMQSNKLISDSCVSLQWKDFAEKFKKALEVDKEDSRTLKLWKQYLEKIKILRLFFLLNEQGIMIYRSIVRRK